MTTRADFPRQVRYYREIDCVACRGTGRLFRKQKLPEPCQVCNGTGRMGVVP